MEPPFFGFPVCYHNTLGRVNGELYELTAEIFGFNVINHGIFPDVSPLWRKR